MVEEKLMIERVKELEDKVNKKQSKGLRLPTRAKVRGNKLKKGFLGVLVVDENLNIHGEKVKVEGSAYRLKDGSYHSTEGEEILMWNGKFPLIVQSSKRINPVNFKNQVNETYGQSYIIAKMLGGTVINKKKTSGGLVVILIIAVIGFILGKFVFKWF